MKWYEELEKLRQKNPHTEVLTFVSDEANDGEHYSKLIDDLNIQVRLTSYIVYDGITYEDSDDFCYRLPCRIERTKHLKKHPWQQAIFVEIQ